MCTIEYGYLRPKKAAALQKWHEEPFTERSPLTTWTGTNATILPLRRLPDDPYLFGRGGVVDSNGQYVSLSAIPDRVQNCYPFEDAEYRDEKVVYCGYLIRHWGHFLIEAVARMWYFLENDPTIDKYVFILNEGDQQEITGNFREFFQLLKVWDKMELITAPITYREVVVPEVAFQFRDYYSQKYLEVFNTIADNVQPQPDWETPEKIFYTRSQFQKGLQYQSGMEALDDFYQRNGYCVMAPEKVSLSKMIWQIRNCKEVAAISGTIPHNMLFGNQGQKLVILERCIPNNDCQVNINRMKDLDTTYIDANIALYPVGMIGPFMMGYTPLLRKYAEDNAMLPPAEQYCTEKYRDDCFKKYMYAYQDEYRYQWFMADWYTECADYLLEAYREGASYFSKYLTGQRPFLREHYFQFHYFKQFIKRILGMM